MKNNLLKAFTLVELIVVITILAILATIAYVSLLGYQTSARDSVRLSDLSNLAKVIELTELETSSYPAVTDGINITFSGSTIWTQGTFGSNSYVDALRLSEIPTDPLTGNKYSYSKTTNTKEYQLGAILERYSTFSYSLPLVNTSFAADPLPNFSAAYIRGNYNGKFITHAEDIVPSGKNIYILGAPSILANTITSTTLQEILDGDAFVFTGKRGIPTSFSGSFEPTNIGWTFTPQTTTTGTALGSAVIVYKGTSDELSTGSGKIDMITQLKAYYSTSDITTTEKQLDISAIDPAGNPNSAIALLNTYIRVELGGLSLDNIAFTEIEATGDGDPLDPNCEFGATDYGECNFS